MGHGTRGGVEEVGDGGDGAGERAGALALGGVEGSGGVGGNPCSRLDLL